MYKLIIFAVAMLLLSSICNGQGKSIFGAKRSSDTSETGGQVNLTAYADNDTVVLVTTPSGNVKGVDMGRFTRLGFTPQTILNLRDFGAIPDDGEDDTEPIQDAIDSAHALGGRVKIIGEAGEYLIGGDLQKTKNGRSCNAQLVVPHNDRVQDSSDGFIYITIEGASIPWDIDGYLVSALGAPDPIEIAKYTTTFRSTISNDGSTYPSILGVAQGGDIGGGVYINHLGLNLRNITFMVNYDGANGGAQLCGVDLNQAISQITERVRISLDTPSGYSEVKTHDLFGFRGINEWGMMNTIRESASMGFKYGIALGEHGIIEKVQTFNCDYALALQANSQGIRVADLIPHGCEWTFGAGLVDGGAAEINGWYHSEKTNTGVGASLGDVYDPTNLLSGELQFIHFRNGGGREVTFFRNGGTKLIAKTVYNGNEYYYGKSTGAIITDSINHTITNGALTVSVPSSTTVTRPHQIGLLAGYTGANRTDGLLATNAAAGTGQNINAGAMNVGAAGGASAATVGYNVGLRGGASGSTAWNIGSLGVTATATTGGNVGGLFTSLLGSTKTVGVMGYLGQPTTMPTIFANAAIVADNGTVATNGSVILAQANGIPKFRVDSVGNMMLNGTGVSNINTPTGNPLDIFMSTNGALGMQLQNLSNGTLARTSINLKNDAGHFALISKIGSGYTTSGLNKANDVVIGNAGAGDIVINNSVAAGVIDLGTNGTLRMKIKANGTVNIVTISTYADNTAATSGGLVAGDLYRTSTGQLMIVF